MITKKRHNTEYSVAKEWARKRNFTKFLLAGMKARLRITEVQEVLTPIEQQRVLELTQELNAIVRAWSGNNPLSRTLFESNKRGK
ncbi:MAG: hypothetical protein WC444_06210 [Candidatus Paceibacterota bacterium]